MSTLKPKEITLSSSKSIEYGEFKSSVTVTLEVVGDIAKKDVQHWQMWCDATTEGGIQTQIERKKERKNGTG